MASPTIFVVMASRAALQHIIDEYSRSLAEPNQRERRLWAARKARQLRGQGGVAIVSRALRMARSTVYRGLAELSLPPSELAALKGRQRRPGGGRKRQADKDRRLASDLAKFFEPSRGRSQAPFSWCCRSPRQIEQQINKKRHRACFRTIAAIMAADGYQLRSKRGPGAADDAKDRDVRFTDINRLVRRSWTLKQPAVVLQLNAKYANATKAPEKSERKRSDSATPNITRWARRALIDRFKHNTDALLDPAAWLPPPSDSDTAAFGMRAILDWWHDGQARGFCGAKELLIVAAGDRDDDLWIRRWRPALQGLADETGLKIVVARLPSGVVRTRSPAQRFWAFDERRLRRKRLYQRAMVTLLNPTVDIASTKVQVVGDHLRLSKRIERANRRRRGMSKAHSRRGCARSCLLLDRLIFRWADSLGETLLRDAFRLSARHSYCPNRASIIIAHLCA